MREPRWVIQQQIPKENSMFMFDESRWINVLTCCSLEEARERYALAKEVEDNWPTRIIKVTEELVTV